MKPERLELLLQVRLALCRAVLGTTFEGGENYQKAHFPVSLPFLQHEMRRLTSGLSLPIGCNSICFQAFSRVVLCSSAFMEHYNKLYTKYAQILNFLLDVCH